MHDRLKVAGLDSPIMWITASNRGWVEAHSAVFDAPWSDSAYSDARMSVNMVLSGKSPIEQMPHFHLGLTAFQGKLDLIKSLRQLSPTYHWPPSVMDAAARSKCIELVRFLHEAGCECSPCALNGASLDGDLDMVRFLVEHGTNARPSQAIDLAASRGHLHVVDYLHTATGESGTFDGLLHAVQAGKAQMADCMLRSFFDPSWDLKLAEDIALSGGDEAVCDVLEAFADERGVATEDDDDGVDFERDAGAS
nr:hypothetical protein HK105_002300 [Polyrhizophydium stewartii]